MSLDNPNIEISSFFKEYIKDKSITNLLEQDNKLFSEIKSLENEKHLLVTQNYKKFVSATETINSIRHSLSGFEENLLTLQRRVNSLVSSFEKVSLNVDPLIHQADKQCMVKRDLKRLKYINDLPEVMEKSYIEYLKSEVKDIKVFENVLNYYSKCKSFLEMHKDNQLVSENFIKTKEMIEKIRTLINEHLIINEFSENQLEYLITCLRLLVKIEDNQSDLIFTFIEKYKLAITRRFDEVFHIKEDGVSELDVNTYVKIYNTFEFSINENEFPFYQSQIRSETESKNENFQEKDIDFSLLASKFFKKGNLIWSIKKIIESGLGLLIEKAFVNFNQLFDEKYISNLSIIFNFIVDLYLKKMKERVFFMNRPENVNDSYTIDPVFLKEAILVFKQTLSSSLFKIKTRSEKEKIHIELTIEGLNKANKEIIDYYEKGLLMKFQKEVYEYVELSMRHLVGSEEYFPHVSYKSKIEFSHVRFNNIIVNDELEALKENIKKLISKYLTIFKGIDYYTVINSSNSDNTQYLLDYLTGLFNIFLSSFKKNRFSKKHIYLGLLMINFISQQDYIKLIIDPVLRETYKNDMLKRGYKSEILKELDLRMKSEQLELKKTLLLLQTEKMFLRTKHLFFNMKFILEGSVTCFRKEVRDFLLDLFIFKKEVDVLLNKTKKESQFQIQSQTQTRKNVPVQIMMESILIKKLVFDKEEMKKLESSQDIVDCLVKVYLKNFVELMKSKKLNQYLHLQFNFDLYLIKNFLVDWIYVDNLNLHEGFIREIKENMKLNCCSFDCKQCDVDSHVLSEVYFNFKQEFSSTFRSLSDE